MKTFLSIVFLTVAIGLFSQNTKIDSYQTLSNYYERSGNYKKSNEYLKKWITANDSINNRELVTIMKEFEFKYENEKKKQQISLQQKIIKQKDRFIDFAVIAGSLITIALLI